MRLVTNAPALRCPPGFAVRLVAEDMIGFPPEPVRFKSGILAPMYVDLRKVLGQVSFRSTLLTFLQNELPEFATGVCEVPVRDVVFAGVATGAISVPAMLADRLGVPFCYIRAEKKEHGLPANVVGKDVKGRKVILFEDVVTMATSSALAASALHAAGASIGAVISFFDYQFPDSAQAFSNLGVLHQPLSCFADVQRYLLLSHPDVAEVTARWHIDPWRWTEEMERRLPDLAHT
jgi:orotate phosphoribosyltransferase